MKRLIFYFLLVLGSIWLGVQVYNYPGYILIYYQQWSIETTAWFLFLILLLAFLLIHLLLNLLRGVTHLPGRIEKWWQAHREDKAIKLLNKGFSDLLKGDYRVAEKKLIKGAKQEQLSFLNYMIAAEAADLQHAVKKRNQYLAMAKQKNAKKGYLVDYAYIQYLLKHQQAEEALTEIVKLRTERPKDPQLLKFLAQSYLQLHDWFHLQLILNELKKYNVFDKQAMLALEHETYLNSFKGHYFSDFAEVQKLWNKMPNYFRHDPKILVAYATHLARWNREHEAEELIRKELKKQYSSELMEYYVTTRSNEPAKQVALGEKYLKGHTDDAASLRAMGILCLRNRLWGQARDYLERSLKREPIPETYSALGYAYEKLGESDKALSYYRKGMVQLPLS